MTDHLTTRHDGVLERTADRDAFAVARAHYAGLGVAVPVGAS